VTGALASGCEVDYDNGMIGCAAPGGAQGMVILSTVCETPCSSDSSEGVKMSKSKFGPGWQKKPEVFASAIKSSSRVKEWVEKTMQLAGVDKHELARRLNSSYSVVRRTLGKNNNIMAGTLFRYIEACGYEVVELRVRKKGGS
jgi:hypothetical protein